MSKKKYSVLVGIILVSISLFICFVFPKPPCTLSSLDKRAVWFSYMDLQGFDYESKNGFIDDFNVAMDRVEKYKNNTVIVQVRPFADALYKSELFPLSEIITKKQSLSFDPLEEMVKIAHERELSIEAWLNPYRISLNKATYQQFIENSSKQAWLDDEHQVIGYATYKYILNPASQDVRDYIVDGVKEVVENYDVDGIHFDDYFYVPGAHNNTEVNERLDHVNSLISDVYSTIKTMKPHVVFGISPQGNYENCIAEGADVDTWLKEEGYVDYVMPQIYWSNEHGANGQTKMFEERSRLFAGLKRSKSVMLYAGLATYRSGSGTNDDQGWKNSNDNISKQVQELSLNGYKGYSLFSYESLLSQAGEKEMQTLLDEHPYK